MATIKKAQLGGLIRKAAKAVIKKTPKKTISLAEKVKANKLSGGLTKAEQKIGKDADKTLKELNINKYNESSSSPVKLTPEQKANNARILKEIKEGKRKNGGDVKKKMKNGGSLSGLTASNRRDKGTDPNGAFTTVQKRTLAGARGKASLTPDKQLGATKMAKRGMKISKKK